MQSDNTLIRAVDAVNAGQVYRPPARADSKMAPLAAAVATVNARRSSQASTGQSALAEAVSTLNKQRQAAA